MLYLDRQKGLKHEHRVYTFELGFQLNFLAQLRMPAKEATKKSYISCTEANNQQT